MFIFSSGFIENWRINWKSTLNISTNEAVREKHEILPYCFTMTQPWLCFSAPLSWILVMQSYRSNGELLWDFVSARPDTGPEHAGSCPPCTRCAASSPLRFCRGTTKTSLMSNIWKYRTKNTFACVSAGPSLWMCSVCDLVCFAWGNTCWDQ